MSNLISNSENILVIVESPNKVKTISNILKTAGFTNATVMASIGHVMLLGNGGTAFNSGISPDKDFKMNLHVAEDKKKVVNDIITKAQASDKIFIMTDGDREGEVIAWSLIKFCKLPINKCFRAITHEITTKAIIQAINNPVPFNDNLVNAGLVRMMSDKLIGFGLSPIGKKYIGAKSIGRCQSVGLKLISDRETEINNFIPELYFNLYLDFKKDCKEYQAKYVGYKTELVDKFIKQADVDAVINNCKGNDFKVTNIEVSSHTESPKPPFCTATFQQAAVTLLGLRVKDAMSCAQKLFEGININGKHCGLITYMRTDSTELSEDFISELKPYIETTYGTDAYVKPRRSKKHATDQDGHEALRVVDLTITPDVLASYINNQVLLKVYKLIWQRTVASAMQNAKSDETIYTIECNDHKFKLSSTKLVYKGFKMVYNEDTEYCSNLEYHFSIGELIKDPMLNAVKKFTKPKARYTEASLVKELQQKEIGRPSTYATIVDTILSPTRGYATLEDKCIVPTDRGMQLAEYCNRAFPTIINLDYTKNMEISLDKIAVGKTDWLEYMNIFYNNLKDIIDSTTETGIAPEVPEKQCPICGSTMVVRRSRFGRLFHGCSTYPKCTGTLSIN